MNKLQEIKNDLDNGCFSRENIKWLIKTVEHQKEVIRNLQEKTRFKNYMKIAQENLALEEALKMTQEQRDFYKQRCELKSRS